MVFCYSSPTETVYYRLGLEPMCWDSTPAKTLLGTQTHMAETQTHGTWFQDLMKLWFLMSHHRKNSVRDKVVGKNWIYSDTERSSLHRVWPSQVANVTLKFGVVSFYRLGNFIC